MMYCAYCSSPLPEGSRYCPSCGAPAPREAASPVPSAALVYTGEGLAVMLLGPGSCPPSAVPGVLSDLCGYTEAEALVLAGCVPTLIARGLTETQAAYLAQCLTEYGMETAIYDRTGSLAFPSGVDTVFDRDGSLLGKVAGALGLIGIGNRITGAIRRLVLPERPAVYTLPRQVPPRPVRHHAIRRESILSPHSQPQPAPPRHTPPKSAPSAPAPRPEARGEARRRPGQGTHPGQRGRGGRGR